MVNALSLADRIRKGDEVRVPFTDVTATDIHPYDIAQVAARALPSSEHEGHAYTLTGTSAPASRPTASASAFSVSVRCWVESPGRRGD